MKGLETLRVAWLGVAGNWLRSLLTMLGIIIGVAAVITLVSVGEGTRQQITERFESLGSNLIMISGMRGTRLEMDHVEAIAQQATQVRQAVPSISQRTDVKYQTTLYETTVEGVAPGYVEVRNHSVATGRFITAEDVSARRRVAVVGQTVVTELFAGRNPLGQRIRIQGQYFTVVGVMAEKGATMGQDADDRVLIPVSTAQRLWRSTQVGTIYAQAISSERAALAVAEVEAYFEAKDMEVRVYSQDELLESVDDSSRILTLMLGAIAGISLVVGGIGIMNIMLVSVTERTREIGVRKAIGAKDRDIMAQFLVESVLLSCGGGLVGILTGLGGAEVLQGAAGVATVVSLDSVLLSFAFAAGVGVFFGLYPAMRAARLDPIDALRRE